MKIKKYIALCLTILMMSQQISLAAFWNKETKAGLGNEIQKEEFPDSKDVEPKFEANEQLVIQGGVEEFTEITLEDSLRFALGNNPRIQSALQDVFAADARIKQAWSSYFPQFSWQTGYTRIKQLQLSDVFNRNLIFNYYVLGQITASQMLYDFGVTQNQVTIRKLDHQGYKIMLTGVVNDVVCEVKKAYYNLQLAFEAKKVAEDMVARYEAFYEQAKAFYMAGTSPKVDVTIAEVNLSNAKLMLIQADNAIEIAMARLSNSMGLPYSNRYKINENLKYNACDITLNEAIDVARESRPEFQLAEVKVEEARQNVKLVKKSYFPTITAEGQYQIGGKNFTSNYGYNFGGYLNFPTINGMLIHSEIKEAKALHVREKANAMNTVNNIYLEVQQAFYTMVEKKNSIPVAFLGMKQAKENYELSYGRYKVGVGNPVELKEAQVAYQNAMLQYFNSLAQYNSSKADLEKYIGKNLAEGELKLDLEKEKVSKKRSKKKS